MVEEVAARLPADGPSVADLLPVALEAAPDEAVDAVARELAAPDGFVRFRVLPRGVRDPLAE